MFKRIGVFTLLLIVLSEFIFAQKKDRIWIFDDGAGIDFNNLNAPFAFNTGLRGAGQENYSSIADNSGNLLFHVNGADSVFSTTNQYSAIFSDVYDRNHQLMPDGDSIAGDYSCTQGSLIIPFPNDTSHYYIFSLNNMPLFNTGLVHGLYYSIVDMAANGGLGDVVSKNNLLFAGDMTEKLTACKHGDGMSWWVICHEQTTNRFIKFLITSSGISSAYFQNIGTVLQINGITGPIIFNRTGDRCLMVGEPNIINVFDFDRCSGTLNNAKIIPNGNTASSGTYLYGASISPNGNFIYVSNLDSLYQYNLTAVNIAASKFLLWNDNDPNTSIGQHQLGPDGKIYIAGYYGTGGSVYNPNFNHFNMNLSVISRPDSAGLACNFDSLSFYLNGRRCMFGLPNMVNYNLEPVSPICNVGMNELEADNISVSIYPSPTDEILNVSVEKSSNEDCFLQIINLLGAVVYEKNFKTKTNVNVKFLPESVYLLKITIGKTEQIYWKKIVIAH